MSEGKTVTSVEPSRFDEKRGHQPSPLLFATGGRVLARNKKG